MDDLRNTDPEDLHYMLLEVESTFAILFAQNELARVATFGEFCDVVARRLRQPHVDTCTSQQAFYRLRAAFRAVVPAASADFAPTTPLAALLPRSQRRQQVARLEQALGLSVRLLEPRGWIVASLLGLLLLSIAGLFFSPVAGLAGLAGAIGGIRLASWLGRELAVTTVRELVEQLLTTNYAQLRRQPGTVNYQELPGILERMFVGRLGLEPRALRPDSPFQ
ncbi:hypothetical protein [Hymenobacter edaphi]|uniref:Uncharacterized protein n=1 Tax=Hymenobacter edaphi TaxID=2211146 RepID=A0A328B730_9BACT|nr:hypothetical protein [Hymenobacter edaphi]RAK63202.1 hypothetical protein DLM85_21690 [Hymenobacter edaphi]